MLWELVDSVSSATYGGEGSASGSTLSEIGHLEDEDDMLNMIDKGNDEGGKTGSKLSSPVSFGCKNSCMGNMCVLI